MKIIDDLYYKIRELNIKGEKTVSVKFLENLQKEIESYFEIEIFSRERKIENLDKKLEEKEMELDDLEDEIYDKKVELESLEDEIYDKEVELENLEDEIHDRKKEFLKIWKIKNIK